MGNKNFLMKLITLKDSNDPEKIKMRNRTFANLKRGLSPKTRWYAYEVIEKYGGNIKSDIDITIAGLFATYDEHASGVGNLGALWRKIVEKRKQKEDNSSALFHFNRLLACKNSKEICNRIIPIIRYAKSESIPVDYEKLYEDLIQFSNLKEREKIIKNWVQGYWRSKND